jgi:signal transduction histidine kinase
LRPLEEPGLEGKVVLAVSRDTTQKRMLEEQMFNTEKLASLGTLAAGVAHELNNPLTAILGFTELLLERFPPGSREYQDLKVIEEQSQHCRHVVENLLDYAKTGVPLGDQTNINDDIEAVLRIVANTALTNKITIDYSLDPRIPFIRANSREIRQVLLNLVNNAIYAMRERGGRLTVFSAVRGNRIMIKVADTGTGIPQELLGKIFDPFFTTKGPGEGTGLGLSVSLGLVQRLGGTITVSSSTEGSHAGEPTGSIFTVVLPLPNEGAAMP